MSIRMPQLHRILLRGTKRGLQTAIREEGWGASVGSLFGVLFLAQVLVLLVIGAHSGLTLLREQTDIRLEILDNASIVQIQDLISNIKSLPYVEEVVYITREEAYNKQKLRDPTLISFLQKFGIQNPFPETVGVRLKTLDDYKRFMLFLQQPVFAKTMNPKFLSEATDQEKQVYRLLDIVTSARLFLFLVVGLLLVVLVFVIIELVRRRAVLRREELFVEQLVGATPLAILVPFCIEVFALLLVALVLSLIFVTGFIYLLPSIVPSLAVGGLFGPWAEEVMRTLVSFAPLLTLAEIIVLPVVASLGTFFALWPKIRSARLTFSS
ncbi:MAG: permease-like cell division protein FtsX [Candidatus Peribacteraceae bacterium]|nr:permease-like cell division protein FtsX [Candidatus Peribacteraceae bacterium]